MARRKFHQFSKLPIELRLKIWNYSMEPRIIRAKWENEIRTRDIKGIYRLSCGPVPKVLQVCTESRIEAKRRYNFVKARLSYNANLLRSHRPEAIWINYDIDTLYFVNWPSQQDFLRWNRRVAKRINGGVGSKIQHVALNTQVLLNLGSRTGYKLDILYQFFQNHPTIESLTIVLDNSNFEHDKQPHKYQFSIPKELKGNILSPYSGRWFGVGLGGGKWGNVLFRRMLGSLFSDFFVKVKGQERILTKWKKFRLENPNWVEPTFPMMSITKSRTGVTF